MANPKKKKEEKERALFVRLPESDIDELALLASGEDLSLAQLVRRMVREYLAAKARVA